MQKDLGIIAHGPTGRQAYAIKSPILFGTFGPDELDSSLEGPATSWGNRIEPSKLQGSFSSIEVVVRRRGFSYPWKSGAD